MLYYRKDWSTTPKPIRIPSDRDRISRVLRNLTDNAARYTPLQGILKISVHGVRKGGVRVGYTNSVEEMVPQDPPLLFERFYRGEKSRSREHGGAGIGLAIVKELVQAQMSN